ncbi:alpha-mannosidase [Lapidilactobacillus wuchangensis]|uniref:alpha-mannosidase n=1 Tax=Lapidilactobacillus wuchangensis TaxID=2486001 RepID=UPI000F7990A0|nr:alpha-mannosidase [Lapidilactobacillus wuchangensis]
MYNSQKIQQQLHYLQQHVYANLQPIEPLWFWQDDREDHRRVPSNANWQRISLNDAWQGRDSYYWLKFTISIPALKPNQRFVLHLDLGRTGGGNNSGFESLMFVNDEPFQAIDSNHQDAFFNDKFKSQKLEIKIMLWSGLEGGGPQQIQHYNLKKVSNGILNDTVRDCYAYLKLIAQTIEELDDDEPLKYDYIKLIDAAFAQFFWEDISNSQLTQDCQFVLESIKTFIKTHPHQKKDFQISAVGHTHIDVAWLWRLRHTREKTVRSFTTVLQLMKMYPDYKFFHSTPQVYEFVKEDYPDIYAQIKQRVKEGRWEADGGTWLEPDTNIPSGEALTRQFLYGTQFFENEFNSKQTVLWLPDVFGYSWSLPQIMRGFNIKNFMTTKISWNDTNRMPHDTFIWEGIDGSKVLTHFITTTDDQSNYRDPSKWMYTYNGEITPHTVLGTYHVYADKIYNNDLLLAYGHGDGGGGSTKEMIENIEIINQLPGLPRVSNTRVDDYFTRLRNNIKNSHLTLANWNGELYLEFHRGTYTSQARVKQQNRQLEFALRNLEILYTQAMIQQDVVYPMTQINGLWTMVLRNQFHDILPGSAISEVYDDNKIEYQNGFDQIAELNRKLQAIPSGDNKRNSYHIRNTNAWTVTNFVTIDEPEQGHFVDEKQNILPMQRLNDQAIVEVTVPALSAINVYFIADDESDNVSAPVKVTGSLQNDDYRISWNPQGQITEIYDLRYQRQALVLGEPSNQLTVYEDRPLEYDNWNIDKDYVEKAIQLKADSIELGSQGPLQKSVVFKYHFGDSLIAQEVVLRDDRRIDFKTHLDWHEHQQLLRTNFKVNVIANEASYDIQYGNVKRSTADNTSWDSAKFETVGHKWADLSQRDYGVALLNDAKYGYSIKKNNLSLSLLKSGIYPDTNADQGKFDFTYSILPHKGDFVEGMVEPSATELNNPLILEKGLGKIAEPLFKFNCDVPVIVDAIKLSENKKSIILRFHEYSGQDTKVMVKPTFKFNLAKKAKLNEDLEQELISDKDDDYSIQLTPYQVMTVAFIIDD